MLTTARVVHLGVLFFGVALSQRQQGGVQLGNLYQYQQQFQQFQNQFQTPSQNQFQIPSLNQFQTASPSPFQAPPQQQFQSVSPNPFQTVSVNQFQTPAPIQFQTSPRPQFRAISQQQFQTPIRIPLRQTLQQPAQQQFQTQTLAQPQLQRPSQQQPRQRPQQQQPQQQQPQQQQRPTQTPFQQQFQQQFQQAGSNVRQQFVPQEQLLNTQCQDHTGQNQNFPQSSFYHAPKRFVPIPPVDQELKRQFLLLFHRDGNTNHTHGSPNDPISEQEMANAPPIDPGIVAIINDLCPRDAFFYSFAPRHMNATMLLQQVFMRQTDAAAILRLARAELYRHEINRRVWYYALLGTLLMRPDLNGYYLAWALDATPDLYLPATVIRAATEGSNRTQPVPPRNSCDEIVDVAQQVLQTFYRDRRSPAEVTPVKPVENVKRAKRQQRPAGYSNGRGRGQRLDCIMYRGTRGATGLENRLWYFREDVMVNQHHWYWHQYFPLMSNRHADRRGEMFYYSHHNIIARYNAERLSNGLNRETALDLRLDGNIGEGYDGDLVNAQSGVFWTPRRQNVLLSDVNHQNDPDFNLTVSMNNVTNLYRTLVSHISQGFLLANRSLQAGQPILEFPLDIRNQAGFNHLGNTVEAAEELSTHPNFYHNVGVHNLGHIVTALASDPDYSCRRPTGVMADLTVTMRDPAFYKVHTFTDDLFEQYKSTLEPYQVNGGEWPLNWQGVRIQNVELLTPATPERQGVRNFVKTYWSVRRFPLEEGIDGSIHEGDVDSQICHQHLNHEPFMFQMNIDVSNCAQTTSGRGTVRLFMAPRYDLNGRRFTMTETRRLMFQLDEFQVNLRQGRNVITRLSQDSSSTKPWSRTLNEMLRDPDNGGQTENCGCGWPDHLYIPKGTPQGMEFDLFAMITNYDLDQVQDTVEDLRIPEPCNSAYLFCGIQYRRYPDARPLGYPFDRYPYSVVEPGNRVRPVRDLEEYVTHVPNMKSSVVVIQHVDTIVGG